MAKLAIQLKDIQMSYKNKTLFTIEEMAIYEGDHIGIVGENGQGKTTLLNLIAGEIKPDAGIVQCFLEMDYLKQVTEQEIKQPNEIDTKLLTQMKVPKQPFETLSGGELKKYQLVKILSHYQMGLLLDEPTTHLDKQSIDFLMKELHYYTGTLLFVSHDRFFLNTVATKILEIHQGKIRLFVGNYDAYLLQKNQEKYTLELQYETIEKERKRLEKARNVRKKQADKVLKVSKKNKKKHIQPNRLFASKQKDTVQKRIQKTVKSIESRINQLASVKLEKEANPIVFPRIKELTIYKNFPIIGDQITLTRNHQKLLSNVNFQVRNGAKIAIVGNNGVEKTTLLKAIYEGESGITISSKVKCLFFQQKDDV